MNTISRNLLRALACGLLAFGAFACTPAEDASENGEEAAQTEESPAEGAEEGSEEATQDELDPELAATTERVAALRQALRAPDADVDALLEDAEMTEAELEEALFAIAADPAASAYYETLSGGAEE